MILKQVTSPFGAVLNAHVVQKLEASSVDPTGKAIAHVYSWPSKDDYVLHEGKGATYTWYIGIPLTQLNSSDFFAHIEQVLISTELSGSPFFGGSIITTEDTLQDAKQRQWAQIKQTREILDAQPIIIEDMRFDADANSKQKIMSAILEMQDVPDTTLRNWTLADNTIATITKSDLIALNSAISTRADTLQNISQLLRARIDAATNVSDVVAVVWSQ